MKKRIIFLWVSSFLLCYNSVGQDTSKIFTQDQLIWFIKNYHPVSQQANLLINRGESSVRQAKGGFDPYIHGDLDQKYFDDKTYFNMLNGGLKVPTWFGVEVKAGMDQNSGLYLNPEDNVPSGGLVYSGLSITLGQGLFIDKRRAALKQAKIYSNSTIAERNKMMNDLYFEGLKQYWKWVESWNQLQIYDEFLELAKVRFNGVKRSFFLGDKTALDTVEALIQVQNRMINKRQYQLNYQLESLELSNFIWFENNTPLIITDSLQAPNYKDLVSTSTLTLDTLNQMLSLLNEQHPDLQIYGLKLSSLAVDKRLKREALKPKINLDYNFLTESIGNSRVNSFSTENYKWGLSFGLPVLLRKERGSLQLTQIKIQETELEREQKLLNVSNKVKSYYTETLNLEEQLKIFSATVANYKRMLDGEKQKFNGGESSLFIINSRENYLIEAQLKYIKTSSKFQVAKAGVYWSNGTLFNIIP